eukprot:Rmarinus@m.28304
MTTIAGRGSFGQGQAQYEQEALAHAKNVHKAKPSVAAKLDPSLNTYLKRQHASANKRIEDRRIQQTGAAGFDAEYKRHREALGRIGPVIDHNPPESLLRHPKSSKRSLAEKSSKPKKTKFKEHAPVRYPKNSGDQLNLFVEEKPKSRTLLGPTGPTADDVDRPTGTLVCNLLDLLSNLNTYDDETIQSMFNELRNAKQTKYSQREIERAISLICSELHLYSVN